MEQWKDVVGYEGRYEVSDEGRVRSLDRIITRRGRWGEDGEYKHKGRLLKQYTHNKYNYVNLGRGDENKFLVHSLILETFVGPRPEKYQACHNDGNPSNNNVNNLRWDTCKNNNNKDKYKHGTMLIGSKHQNSKLKEDEVWLVKRLLHETNLYHREIAKMFKVSRKTIGNIKNNKAWTHVEYNQKENI